VGEYYISVVLFFFSSRRRHTRFSRDWSSDVCSSDLAGPTGVNIALLTGRDKGRARESILMGLLDGSIQIVVGTHAIFQESVAYRNLGLVVIDEQHRFGVGQRLMLTQKGKVAPHCLAMTAT